MLGFLAITSICFDFGAFNREALRARLHYSARNFCMIFRVMV